MLAVRNGKASAHYLAPLYGHLDPFDSTERTTGIVIWNEVTLMSIAISAADVARAKKLAKHLKSSFPQLTHAKRLDYAAQQLFKARNYHELNKWRELAIQQHVSARGNTVTCAYCGLLFVPGVKEDRDEHRSRHDTFEEAVTALGYLPEQTAQQEHRKQAGYRALSDGADTYERMAGALDVLRGWFDRSLVSAIVSGYWKQHPKFETYISFMIGGLNQIHFPDDVINELKNMFGQVDGVIERGNSYWYPLKKNA
jgi:hypothetical protein